MSTTGGGSFIPKRSTGKVSSVRSGRRIYIFSYIAYVLFFGTLLSVVGIFFLHNQAETQLQEYITLVDGERKKFQEQSEIHDIKSLDTQLSTAEQILSWHAAPSIVFEALEEVIVASIQLENFEYMRETGGPIQLSFGGRTDSFDVLMFQREIMSQHNLLSAADIVEVSYGAGATGDEGEVGVSQSANLATLTFTFEDITSIGAIGYVPRSFERVVDTEEGSEVTQGVDTAATDGDLLDATDIDTIQ